MRFFSQIFNKIWQKLYLHSNQAGSYKEIYQNVNLKKLEKIIGCGIKNPAYFYQALTHRSFISQFTNGEFKSNERLEFLGDSILNMVVGEYLYNNFPDVDEGDLTKMRSRLVNRKALAVYAKEIGLWDFLVLSPGVIQSLDKGSDTILADGFEAIVGAIFLDSGLESTNEFIKKCLLKSGRIKAASTIDQNYKSRLLEYSQANGSGVPRYNTISSEGPDHDKIFKVEVIVNNQVCGTGTGKNKKEAEQAAAAAALKTFEIIA
ncbi:MAG: ribonuclease III [Bacteroidota bacterium]|nr:ribonuclease III [Bacteroidota bacterium]